MPAKYNGQPSQAADITSMCLQYLGVEPTLDTHYDRLQVPMEKRVQSRIDQNNAPDHMVKRYAEQMSESHFPAPLVTADHITVDGNTRLKALAKRNTRYIEAWVLPITALDADPTTKHKLFLLSMALNAMNGLPLELPELLKYAKGLIQANSSDEEVRGKTGLELPKITMLRAQIRAEDRLTHIGINPTSLGFSDTVLRAFGKPNAMKLDDTTYREVIELGKDAGLKAGQVNDLAVALNSATSPETRRERLARERQALEPQIQARRHGQLHPMQTEKLRRAIEMLLNNPITAFVESNPAKTAEYIELLDKALDKLREIRDLQSDESVGAAQTTSQAHETRTSVQ